MAKLAWIGRVYKFTKAKAKRFLDRDFASFYGNEGKDVEDIPNWRNASFTGEESYTAFAKYAHSEPVLDEQQKDAVFQAAQWMRAEFYPYMSDSALITTQAVIDGTEGGNSPGYPWNRCHKSCDDFYDSNDAELLNEYWERCVTRDGAFTVWNSFLKEELRKIAKIRAGDIRQINGCAVEFKIAMNRFCLDMNEKFYDSHLNTASAVGLNKYRGGWNRLFTKLSRHSHGFSLDVKRWDSHFPRILLGHIRDFRWQCLSTGFRTPTNRMRFWNLYEQIIESVTVMPWGELLMTRLGNPSGSPNTVVDNTLGLYMLVAYAYIRSAISEGHEPSYGGFCRDVSLALYGDDNTFTGSERGLQLLNFDTLFKYGAELGFVITDGGSSVPRPVMELDFLSSGFVVGPCGIIVAKPKAPEKALASMAFRSDGNRLTSWSRACAHRINSFWDRPRFLVADRYCQYLRRLIDAEAQAEGWEADWKAMKAEYLDEQGLLALWCAAEGRA